MNRGCENFRIELQNYDPDLELRDYNVWYNDKYYGNFRVIAPLDLGSNELKLLRVWVAWKEMRSVWNTRIKSQKQRAT